MKLMQRFKRATERDLMVCSSLIVCPTVALPQETGRALLTGGKATA